MRTILRKFSALLIACSVFLGACVSATPQKKAYQALESIQATVETGMQVAAKLHKDGVIGDTEKAQVLDVYSKYQKAMFTALYTLQETNTAWSDTGELLLSVTKAAGALIDLVNSLKARATPVVTRPANYVPGATGVMTLEWRH